MSALFFSFFHWAGWAAQHRPPCSNFSAQQQSQWARHCLTTASSKPACTIFSAQQHTGNTPNRKSACNLQLSFTATYWHKVKMLNNFGCTWPRKAVLAFLESGYRGWLNHTHLETWKALWLSYCCKPNPDFTNTHSLFFSVSPGKSRGSFLTPNKAVRANLRMVRPTLGWLQFSSAIYWAFIYGCDSHRLVVRFWKSKMCDFAIFCQKGAIFATFWNWRTFQDCFFWLCNFNLSLVGNMWRFYFAQSLAFIPYPLVTYIKLQAIDTALQ